MTLPLYLYHGKSIRLMKFSTPVELIYWHLLRYLCLIEHNLHLNAYYERLDCILQCSNAACSDRHRPNWKYTMYKQLTFDLWVRHQWTSMQFRNRWLKGRLSRPCQCHANMMRLHLSKKNRFTDKFIEKMTTNWPYTLLSWN